MKRKPPRVVSKPNSLSLSEIASVGLVLLVLTFAVFGVAHVARLLLGVAR